MRKKKISERLSVKIITYFVTVLTFCGALACVVGTGLMAEYGFYVRSKQEVKEEQIADLVSGEVRVLLDYLIDGRTQGAQNYYESRNVMYRVLDKRDRPVTESYDAGVTAHHFIVTVDEDSWGTLVITSEDERVQNYIYTGSLAVEYLENGRSLHMYVREDMVFDDDFRRFDTMTEWAYSLKNYLPVLAIVLVLISIVSFVLQMCCAGHRYGCDKVEISGISAVPFDLLTVIYLVAAVFTSEMLRELSYGMDWLFLLVLGAVVLCATVAVVAYCLILAVQIKARSWWKNTVIGRVLILVWKVIRLGLRGCVKVCRVIFNNLPGLVQLGIVILLVLVAEVLLMLLFSMDREDILGIWLAEKVLLIPVLVYAALVLMKLRQGSEALAEGNLNYQVDTKYMFGDFEECGENLNSIAEGMNLAVEERLRSERLKTELITNVSHDIKTPLTSIINYAELITEETTENEKITEYAQVLHRQSARLKKLIEDLMEASKASTGNIEVHMVPCEVGVLLTQTKGEYEQRLGELDLELIARQPEQPVRIMADGKLLWRIFDNLLNNICKYAMQGTRVYLSVEELNGEVIISFKNISRYPLDVTGEELKERFARGDRSRNTEGNGLGLSIAESLTQLQNGRLELTVDGDFFKAVLIFHAIE